MFSAAWNKPRIQCPSSVTNVMTWQHLPFLDLSFLICKEGSTRLLPALTFCKDDQAHLRQTVNSVKCVTLIPSLLFVHLDEEFFLLRVLYSARNHANQPPTICALLSSKWLACIISVSPYNNTWAFGEGPEAQRGQLTGLKSHS